MSTAQRIKGIAEEIMTRLENKVYYLERNPPKFDADPEQHKAYNAERDAALKERNLARDRHPHFCAERATNYQCPNCWIASGVSSSLDPRGGGTGTYDVWHCDTCDLQFDVAFGLLPNSDQNRFRRSIGSR